MTEPRAVEFSGTRAADRDLAGQRSTRIDRGARGAGEAGDGERGQGATQRSEPRGRAHRSAPLGNARRRRADARRRMRRERPLRGKCFDDCASDANDAASSAWATAASRVAPAKLNLFLKCRAAPDGFHELRPSSTRSTSATRSRRARRRFRRPARRRHRASARPVAGPKESNLAARRRGIPPPLRALSAGAYRVEENRPARSGTGGGSSDAALCSARCSLLGRPFDDDALRATAGRAPTSASSSADRAGSSATNSRRSRGRSYTLSSRPVLFLQLQVSTRRLGRAPGRRIVLPPGEARFGRGVSHHWLFQPAGSGRRKSRPARPFAPRATARTDGSSLDAHRIGVGLLHPRVRCSSRRPNRRSSYWGPRIGTTHRPKLRSAERVDRALRSLGGEGRSWTSLRSG